MNEKERNELIDTLIEGDISEADFLRLEAELSVDPAARKAYFDRVVLSQALAEEASAFPTQQPTIVRPHRSVWLQWRPLMAAAAGWVIGLFSASVVFGFVAQRGGGVKKVPLAVYNPGLENAETILVRGVPKGVGQWGADSAAVVTAESGVQPLEGKRMLRLEPIPREENVKNLPSRVYQVLDLRSLPRLGVAGDAEVWVSASFFAADGDVTSRYLVRAFALKETPEQATQGFWPKTQEDGVVSVTQRFETPAGDRGWHTFSLKMPLPRGAQSLVFILGAGPAEDASAETSVHYVDDVQVSVFTPQAALP